MFYISLSGEPEELEPVRQVASTEEAPQARVPTWKDPEVVPQIFEPRSIFLPELLSPAVAAPEERDLVPGEVREVALLP